MKSYNSRDEVGGLTCAQAFHIIFGLRAKRVARERVSEGQTWKGFLAIKSPFALRPRAWRYPSNGELCCLQATCGLASPLARNGWSRSLTERGSLLSSLLSRSARVHDDIPRMENSLLTGYLRPCFATRALRVISQPNRKGFLAIKSPFAFRPRAWRYPSNGELFAHRLLAALLRHSRVTGDLAA